MQRTDLQDTSLKAWQLMLARLQQLTPEEKARMTFERIEAARSLRRVTEHLRDKQNPS